MRNQLSRRTVLRGAGVSVALPLLEAMAPVSVQAATGYRRQKEPTADGICVCTQRHSYDELDATGRG